MNSILNGKSPLEPMIREEQAPGVSQRQQARRVIERIPGLEDGQGRKELGIETQGG